MAKKIGGGAKAARRRTRKKATKILARKKKEFTYRGLTIEELQKMPLEELAELLPSRARRSLRRGFSDEQKKLLDDLKANKKEVSRTHRRDLVVIPEMVNKRIAIYNGKEWKEVLIQPEMIGHFLGEFALTRTFEKHAGPGVGATRSSKFLPLK